MVFIWKEIRRFGWPLRAIIWFPLAIAGSYVIIALLTGYVQTARSLGKVSYRVEASHSDEIKIRKLIESVQPTRISLAPSFHLLRRLPPGPRPQGHRRRGRSFHLISSQKTDGRHIGMLLFPPTLKRER